MEWIWAHTFISKKLWLLSALVMMLYGRVGVLFKAGPALIVSQAYTTCDQHYNEYLEFFLVLSPKTFKVNVGKTSDEGKYKG